MSKIFRLPAVGLILAIVAVGSIFIVTVCWRLQLASEITGDRTEIVTAQVYAWLQNWVHEGPLSMHFTMPYKPLSIESFDLRHRDELYRSYPPGVLVPPFLLFLLFKQAPITLLTDYGLVCHAIVVVSVVVAVFVVVSRAMTLVSDPVSVVSILPSTLLAIAAGIFMTVASGPAYFFTRIYVFDTAVLPWFGLSIMVEAIYAANIESRKIAWVATAFQMIFFTTGLWIDWLFVVLIFVWTLTRIVEQSLGIRGIVSARQSICIGGAVFLANLSFIFAWRVRAGIDQTGDYGVTAEIARTIAKFTYRAGASDDVVPTNALLDKLDVYLVSYFAINISQLLITLFGSLLIVFSTFILTRKFARSVLLWPLMSVATLSTFPMMLHVGLLRQHVFNHDFTILKFAFPISVLVLALAPAAASVFFAKMLGRYFRYSSLICSVVACSAAISGIYFSVTRYDVPQREFPPLKGGIGIVGQIIERNVTYDDVVFSPQIAIDKMSFEAGFSRKLVYRSQDIENELPKIMGAVCRPFNLVVVSDEFDPPQRATAPSEVWRDSTLVFYRWRDLRPTWTCPAK